MRLKAKHAQAFAHEFFVGYQYLLHFKSGIEGQIHRHPFAEEGPGTLQGSLIAHRLHQIAHVQDTFRCR